MPGDGGKYNFNRKEGTHRQCGAAGRIPGGCWRPVTVAAHPLILRFHVVGDEAWLTGCHQPCFSAVSCRESTLERSLSLADQTERGENEHYHNPCRQAVKKNTESATLRCHSFVVVCYAGRKNPSHDDLGWVVTDDWIALEVNAMALIPVCGDENWSVTYLDETVLLSFINSFESGELALLDSSRE